MDNTLASGISTVPHLAALDKVFSELRDNLDYTPMLFYLIDTAPAELLPYLAIQFDVLGYKGWGLINTDAEKRALLKNAANLHRYKGTPYAIEAALESIGFSNITITEGCYPLLNGYFKLDGEITLGSLTWPYFKVDIGLGGGGASTVTETEMRALIEIYKNKRSRLAAITFSGIVLNDTFDAMTEVFTIEQAEFTDHETFAPSELLTEAVTFDDTEGLPPEPSRLNGFFDLDGSVLLNGTIAPFTDIFRLRQYRTPESYSEGMDMGESAPFADLILERLVTPTREGGIYSADLTGLFMLDGTAMLDGVLPEFTHLLYYTVSS